MKGLMAICCAMVAANAQAGSISPFVKPSGYALESATRTDQSGNPMLYGATDTTANWTIPQWGAAQDLPDLARVPGSSTRWVTHNANAAVNVSTAGDSSAQMLEQDAALLPCATATGQPNEFDLFLQPNTIVSSTYPLAVNTRYYANQSAFPTFAQMATLNAGVTYALINAHADNSGAACPFNQAGASINVVLVNTVAVPEQVLFYDLQISTICETPVDGAWQINYLMCEQQISHPTPFWYATGAPVGGTVRYGYNDYMPSYGYQPIEDNATHALTFQLYPVLCNLVQANTVGMDKTLANWRFSAVYLGQAVWGGTFLQTKWQHLALSLTTAK